ncbi:hypothetical protein P154DRAFT_535403 [Amniculicola lignicola CBS 123094]|uniref:Uncharacterized protein n=1 Tax=Amniculicola lignicola CBS 123094 TaxID=1392246 RepID=A0A6A5WHR0_9PLEO|nr:hypothetical protein P154DRAFT_535403 [Amniculicola lignicola CBS 123094]
MNRQQSAIELFKYIELAKDMKKDSTSMSAIAALTMVFLPGTFIASVLSAGIFESQAGTRSFKVTGLWWLYIATTLPVTMITVFCWWWYKRQKEKRGLDSQQKVLKDDTTSNES